MGGTTHLIVRGARRAAGLLGLAWWTATAVAKEEPLLEVGVGVGAIGFEDYRGSDTSHGYALPIGYLVYNGKFLTADRDGIRGKTVRSRLGGTQPQRQCHHPRAQ